jgi:DNA-3-methyladenine glycosylase
MIFPELNMSASEAAKRLLGCILEREIDGQTTRVRIVETESYDQTDAASHSYNGRTPRTDVMFGPAGHLYVYFTYGMHYCCNIVIGEEGYGAAVLIRAVEPLEGEAILEKRRGSKTGVELTNGPAKLCQALAIDRRLNGHDLSESPLRLVLQKPMASTEVVAATRVGISKAKDALWRFYIADNAYVSKK